MIDQKEKFRLGFDALLSKYEAAEKVSPDAIEVMARGSNGAVAELYALKKHADPELFKEFKKFADMRLAWNTGEPPVAVENFSLHKNLEEWQESGTDMILPLKIGQKCSPKLRDKIKADFQKMTGREFKSEYILGEPDNPYIQIPFPDSTILKGRLVGNTIAEHGLSGTPLPPSLIAKVGTDPIFRAWDAYQKKLLAAADSPAGMLTAFSEMTMLLPLNYLNEVLTGLSNYLKEWADQDLKGGPRETPRTPGGPTPSPDESHDPDKTPTPSDGDHGPDKSRTFGELNAGTWFSLMANNFNNEALIELGTMQDAKSKALYALMTECKALESNPAALTGPADAGLAIEKKIQVQKQFSQMLPFIIKHARDRGNLSIDNALKMAPSDLSMKDLNEQISRIETGVLTPDGKPIVEQTSYDFAQLFDLLNGDTATPKREDFNQTYNNLSRELQNNALLRAVKDIIDAPKVKPEQRRKQLQELMNGDTVWTPQDLAAADTLMQNLYRDKHISEMPPKVPIKPYGQKARGREMDIKVVASDQIQMIENELDAMATEGSIPDCMVYHKDKEATGEVSVTEAIDKVSGSITMRVQEGTDKPWYVTYCEDQKKIVLMDKDKKMRALNFDEASPLLQHTCAQLAKHYVLIQNDRSPFDMDKPLTETFATLMKGAGKVKTPHEVDDRGP